MLADVCEELPSLVLEPEQHERVPRAQRPLRGLHVPRGHRTHARRPLAHALPAVHGSRTPPQVTVLHTKKNPQAVLPCQERKSVTLRVAHLTRDVRQEKKGRDSIHVLSKG